MPVQPEKRQLENHVHGAIAAQFWSQEVQSTRCLSGKVVATPCEPQPLQIIAPAGLSRTQFLIASHAVGLPLFPSMCGDHGGLVLDRVLLQGGDTHWWGALTGRLKAQRMAAAKHKGDTMLSVLGDPSNYALAAVTSIKVSPDTSLRASLHSDTLQHIPESLGAGRSLWRRCRRKGSSSSSTPDVTATTSATTPSNVGSSAQAPPAAATAASAGAGNGAEAAAITPPFQQQQQQPQQQGAAPAPATLALQLRHQLDGLDLAADLAVNELSVDGVRHYSSTPLRMSVDLAPPSKRLQGLMYRIGLQGVVAPHQMCSGRPAGSSCNVGSALLRANGNNSSSSTGGGSNGTSAPTSYALAVHMQAALALGGEHMLWKQGAATPAPTNPPPRQLLKVWPPAAPPAAAGAAAAAAVGAAGTAVAAAGQAATAARDFASSTQPLQVNGQPEVTTAAQEQQRASRKGMHVADKRRDAAAASTGGAPGHKTTTSSSSSSGAAPAATKDYNGHPHLPYDVSVITPIQIQDALQNSCASLERLSTDIRSWTGRVVEGGLVGGKSSSSSSSSHQQGTPLVHRLMSAPAAGWSSFLPVPHIKVSGLVGVLARAPLHSSVPTTSSSSSNSGSGTTPGSSSSSGAAAAASRPHMTAAAGGAGGSGTPSHGSPVSSVSGHPQQQQSHRWGGLGGWQGGAAASPARQLLAAGSGALEQTQQLLRGTSGGRMVTNSSIRPFACGGISCQFGQLQRNLFDYTRLEAACDIGLTGPEVQQQQHHHHQHHHQQHPWGSSSHMGGGSSSSSGLLAAAPGGTGGRHPALALEHKGVWHALTLSATQQLVGPVRLRADWRWAVDSNAPCPRGSALLQPKAPLQLLQHVGGMRPSLVDSAYGLDVMLPGSSGLVRLVAWWAPGRREGMLEVRLL